MLEQLRLIGTIGDEEQSPDEPDTESEQEVSLSAKAEPKECLLCSVCVHARSCQSLIHTFSYFELYRKNKFRMKLYSCRCFERAIIILSAQIEILST